MENTYSPKQFGALIGKSVLTLQRWDKAGILPAHRTPTNRRYYTHDQYLENTYSPKQFGALIGKSVLTLQRWDKAGILPAHRTPTNRRYYTHDQYLEYRGLKAT